MKNPFRCEQGVNLMRWDKTIKLLGERMGYVENILDIGPRGLFTERLEEEFNLNIYNTNDMDLDVLPFYPVDYPFVDKFDCVFIFEVLEHLFNPLQLLLEIKKFLKVGGRIYITYPHRPHFWWYKTHFHEFDEYRFKELIKRAGLKITYHTWWHGRKFKIWGLRPMIRYFVDKNHFYELRVI